MNLISFLNVSFFLELAFCSPCLPTQIKPRGGLEEVWAVIQGQSRHLREDLASDLHSKVGQVGRIIYVI